MTTSAQRHSTSRNKRTAALLFESTSTEKHTAAEGMLSPGNSSVKRSKWKDVDLLTRKNKPSSLLPSSCTDYIDDNQDLLLARCLSDLNDMGDAVVGDAGSINPTNGINSSCTIDASNITDILMDESVVYDAGSINPLCTRMDASEVIDDSIFQLLVESVEYDAGGINPLCTRMDASEVIDDSIFQLLEDSNGASLLDPSEYAVNSINQVEDDGASLLDAGPPNPLCTRMDASEVIDDSIFQLLEDSNGASLLDPFEYAVNSINQVEDDGASLLDAGPPSLAGPSHHSSDSPSECADIINQVEDDGASLLDAGPPSLADPSFHDSDSLSECADNIINQVVKEKLTKPASLKEKKVGLAYFLGHFASVKNKLPGCTSDVCNLFCEAAGETYCRECKFKSASYVPTNNNAEGINDDYAGLAKGIANRGITKSEEYAAFMLKPCHSPASRRNGNTYERFFAVDNLGDFNSNFQNIVGSKGRDHQISSIPLIVYVMMLALGFEKSEVKLREEICGMILEENVPKYNNFIFSRLHRFGPIGRNKDFLKRVSVVVWASLFALDLLAYTESSNEVDKLANVFFFDEMLVEMNNADVAHLFASMGYSIDLCSRVLEHDMMQHTVMVSSSRFLTKLSYHSGPTKVRAAIKWSLVLSVLNGGISVGFSPELGGDAQYLSGLNPWLEDFYVVACSGSTEKLRHYLDLMIGSLVPPDQSVEVVYCKEKKTIRMMPLFILAYLGHLKRTALKCGTAFECRLLGATANDLNLVNSSGKVIKQPSFANFRLKPSAEYATDLVKMLVSTFSQRPLSSILGSGISGETGTFSFNCKPLEEDTLYLGSLVAKIANSPQQYMDDSRFSDVVRKFHHLFAEVLSVSNEEGIVTAKNAACLNAGVLLSEDEFPVLLNSKKI